MNQQASVPEFLRRNNFLVVKITAEAELCFQRRSKRGDKTLGSAHHSTEQGLDEIAPNYQIENNSTLEDLRTEVQTFIEGIKNDFDAQ